MNEVEVVEQVERIKSEAESGEWVEASPLCSVNQIKSSASAHFEQLKHTMRHRVRWGCGAD